MFTGQHPMAVQQTSYLYKTNIWQFLLAVSKAQNAGLNFKKLENYNALVSATNITLSLRNVVHRSTPPPQLQTYEQIGFCAIIPHKTRFSALKIPFLKPFSYQSQIILILTILTLLAIWRLFKVIKFLKKTLKKYLKVNSIKNVLKSKKIMFLKYL